MKKIVISICLLLLTTMNYASSRDLTYMNDKNMRTIHDLKNKPKMQCSVVLNNQRDEANYKNADKRAERLKPRETLNNSQKKPASSIPGSLEYARSKNYKN